METTDATQDIMMTIISSLLMAEKRIRILWTGNKFRINLEKEKTMSCDYHLVLSFKRVPPVKLWTFSEIVLNNLPLQWHDSERWMNLAHVPYFLLQASDNWCMPLLDYFLWLHLSCEHQRKWTVFSGVFKTKLRSLANKYLNVRLINPIYDNSASR